MVIYSMFWEEKEMIGAEPIFECCQIQWIGVSRVGSASGVYLQEMVCLYVVLVCWDALDMKIYH